MDDEKVEVPLAHGLVNMTCTREMRYGSVVLRVGSDSEIFQKTQMGDDHHDVVLRQGEFLQVAQNPFVRCLVLQVAVLYTQAAIIITVIIAIIIIRTTELHYYLTITITIIVMITFTTVNNNELFTHTQL